MEIRRFLRGRVDDDRLDSVIDEVAARYGREEPSVRYLDADNWLSTPLVLDGDLFVKVISKQNSLVHALITTGRNLGVFSAGTEGFFEHFGTPYGMAKHELEATERMRDIGLNAPEPLEALEVDGLGVVVLEYLPEFRALDELDRETERELAPELFAALRTMHDHGLAHGDLRAENVLILDDDLLLHRRDERRLGEPRGRAVLRRRLRASGARTPHRRGGDRRRRGDCLHGGGTPRGA